MTISLNTYIKQQYKHDKCNKASSYFPTIFMYCYITLIIYYNIINICIVATLLKQIYILLQKLNIEQYI